MARLSAKEGLVLLFRTVCLMMAIWLSWPSLGVGGGSSFGVMTDALQVVHAVPLSHFTSLTAQVNASFVSESQVRRMARRSADLLGLPQKVVQQSTPFWHSATVRGPQVTVRAESVKLRLPSGWHGETVLIVDQTGRRAGVQEAMAKIVQRLAPLGETFRSSAVIMAEIPGHVTNTMMGQLQTIVRQRLRARLVESVASGGLNVQAFDVPDLEPAVGISGKTMNLQLAMSYDSYHGWTQVTLGSPLITISY